ncbi:MULTISPECIES: MurR/RpiR family transcriptional regulator [Lacticaseibacillus]|uniref:RpiR family transcriptional regulator n=2 Tax=Lacticaseibacillus TaxID=2759736 RepID=A0AAN1C626_LACCA|nr:MULTISPECIES: MurR/RpiR family transcriptional regulator [Lacticaseibacillus]ARY90442.1 RpiR family transcriptional regulator [Lacticaseibacillus casei]KAB1969812.1 MurR/RpiR family transcriptional regulator [Lacticaseibacillus casei]WLV81062.1 MurR/RpiR family transcriptional regulator [Lacticaseibacillus sp. NCIMB 15473]WNX25021.1 MurR/RpiR family transcriptional regulator [Lacticaseibacillus casei]WNX27793.1 MurR/RpiR family transcriptional regulator [Lacticaseibacillus casei]
MHDFLVQLQIYKPNLSRQEKKLADFLQTHPDRASQANIAELSAITGVSTATISRFAKALGYPNFQALRMALVQSSPEPDQTLFAELSPDDSVETLAQKIFTSNIDALRTTLANLDTTALAKAIEWITHADHLGLFGLGASNLVALDGYHKFLRTAIPVAYAADYHMQLMAATHLGANDAMILTSHSGEDKDAIALADLAKQQQVPLIVITGSPASRLAKMADAAFVAVAEESRYRTEALHALIAELSLMDTLFMISAIQTNSQTAPLFRRVRATIDATRR